MVPLIAAAAVFLGLHLLIAGTRLRDAITGAIGEGPYLGLFSLASIAAIAWLVMAFNAAQASAGNPMLYTPWIGVRHLAIPVVALAFLLAMPGLLLPSPTSLKQEGAAARRGRSAACCASRVIRSSGAWRCGRHSMSRPMATRPRRSFSERSCCSAFSGTFSIDAKRRRKMGADWDGFAAKTSNVPFAAILRGRTGLRLGEIFDWRVLAAAIVFAGVLFSHARLFGVSPFPSGWVPY